LLLVAGGLSLGVALQHTGLVNLYAGKLHRLALSPTAYLIIFGFLTMALSNVMSHTATATLLIPLGLVLLVNAKIDVALIIALSSATAMLLPVSTPPNAIVFSTGYLEQKDFQKAGLLIGIVGPLLIYFWVTLIH
jgi:sodium-dependent dicarboxylate transporter 2/3/5